ncbi:YrbL family protein [Vagococcus sp. WN89Y]|uniref:YrbL family protein n=1 Tax=Vagococcus sp. WN89Y TaxID=3457258 RepID=UPI003FCD1EF6
MLILKNKIGSGRHRQCYNHPHDNDKCIKVLYNPDDGGIKEVKRETSYYRRKSSQIQACQAVPNYYGKIKTDRGHGHIFDLVRDYDGQVSKSLEYYIQRNEITGHELQLKLKELRHSLIKSGISTMTLKEYNILYRKTAPDEGYLMVIDNIGESEFLPISSLFRFLHRKKIDRIFQRFFQRLETLN